jgi:hypothetical protein
MAESLSIFLQINRSAGPLRNEMRGPRRDGPGNVDLEQSIGVRREIVGNATTQNC